MRMLLRGCQTLSTARRMRGFHATKERQQGGAQKTC